VIRLIAIIIILQVIPGLSNAQEKNIVSLDLGLLWNHKGFFTLYDGVVDIGGGYHHHISGGLYGGFSIHAGFLRRQSTPMRNTILRPGLNVQYQFQLSERFRIIPKVNAGYAFLLIGNSEFEYNETQSGWNPGGEIQVLWKQEIPVDLYLFGRFDYIYLSKDENFTRLEYYRNVYLFSAGLGLWIKTGNSEKMAR
jgi:hypothetical protein